METVQATATMVDENGNSTGEKVTGSVEYNFGADLTEAMELFGEDIIYSQFKQNATIALQGIMRRAIQSGKSGDELQAAVSEWKPGVRTRTGKSPADKIKDLLAGKSPEEIQEILSSLSFEDDDSE